MPSTAIVWLRLDLRLNDHPPLVAALAEHERVVPLFVLDPALLHGRLASGPRTAFMLDCLRELGAALRARGSASSSARDRPSASCGGSPPRRAQAVYWASDATPYAMARDRPRPSRRRHQRAVAAPALRHAVGARGGGAGEQARRRRRRGVRAAARVARLLRARAAAPSGPPDPGAPAADARPGMGRRRGAARRLAGRQHRLSGDYPAPVVDHAQERRRALARYAAARS